MSKKAEILRLDGLLRPLGFTRQITTWNRKSGYVIEVIDIQVSKLGDAATLNAGVLDTDAHVKLWGSEPPKFVKEPTCTVRARIGELIDGKDLWWQLIDEQVGDKIAQAVTEYALPFVKRMHSRQGMVQWLIDAEVVKRKYPQPIVNLAILQGLLGEVSKACALLAEVQNKPIGAWRARAVEVAERIGCAR